jgi:hypothetical protein
MLLTKCNRYSKIITITEQMFYIARGILEFMSKNYDEIILNLLNENNIDAIIEFLTDYLQSFQAS